MLRPARVALLLLVAVSFVQAQPVINNEFSATGRVEDEPRETPARTGIYSEIRADWGSGSAVFLWNATAYDSFAEETPLPEIDELYIRWFPVYFADIRVGRMIRDDGFAELFSPFDLYMGTDLARLSRGQFDRTRLGRDMVEATVLGGSWYVRGRAAWDTPRLTIPSADRPEFPDKDIPRSVASRSNPDTIFQLNEIVATGFPGSADLVDTYGVEIGWSGWFADARATVVQGIRPVPAIEARVLFPDGLTGPYDVILVPQWVEGTTVAAGIQSTVGAFRVWGETSYAIDTTVVVIDHGPGLVTVPATQEGENVLDTVAGVSFQSARPVGIVFAELRQDWRIGDAPDDYTTAFGFTNFLGIGASFTWDRSRLAADMVALVSTEDTSIAAVPAMSWSPIDYLDVSVSTGVLWGDRTTVFGQLEWPAWVEARVVLRL